MGLGKVMDCKCAFCESDRPFDFPDALLARMAEGNVVLFAGAGISTENPEHCKTTLYDEIKNDLKCTDDLSFPELMDKYCLQADGRIELTRKIRKRIEYFKSFRGFYVPMTRFHRAIRPLFMIKDVVTTNWDDFFEIESGLDPFVYERDLALIEGSERRLIKIHGSITNFGSIVATSDDYRKSLYRLSKSMIGAYLKNLLATKTVVYTGYSLRDPNYLNIAKTVARLTHPFTRQSYFIAPSIDVEHLRATKLPLTSIKTDGSYFFEQFRIHYNQLENFTSIVSDDVFDECESLLLDVNDIHTYSADLFLRKRKPLLIYALSYQDGLQDSLMRIKDSRKKGEY